ncbi:MAG: GYD domain-containing protein [Gemmatimonadales bacterium]
MAKYLIQGSYSPEGVKGLARDGGTKRRAFIEEMISKTGGKVESFYYAFGDGDVYVTCELPDTATAAALSLAVNGSGAVAIKTILLISAEEMDQAAKKQIGYRPPGAT